MEFRNTDEIKARTGVAKRTARGGGLSIDREPWKWLPVLRTCKNFNVLEARELSSVVGSGSSLRGKFADVPGRAVEKYSRTQSPKSGATHAARPGA